MQKRDFETYQKRFRDFEILPKFSETHVFRGTIRHPSTTNPSGSAISRKESEVNTDLKETVFDPGEDDLTTSGLEVTRIYRRPNRVGLERYGMWIIYSLNSSISLYHQSSKSIEFLPSQKIIIGNCVNAWEDCKYKLPLLTSRVWILDLCFGFHKSKDTLR